MQPVNDGIEAVVVANFLKRLQKKSYLLWKDGVGFGKDEGCSTNRASVPVQMSKYVRGFEAWSNSRHPMSDTLNCKPIYSAQCS